MTSLCLIRHGQTAWNAEGRIQGQEDTPLSPMGVEQVIDIWQGRGGQFSVIYSSPLLRAFETANIISTIEQGIIPDDRLKERHYGLWQGMSDSEVKEKNPIT